MRRVLAYGKTGREIQPFRAWKIAFSRRIFGPYPLGREAAISQIDPAYCRVFSPDNAARLPRQKSGRAVWSKRHRNPKAKKNERTNA
jgi:hypothetical protein